MNARPFQLSDVSYTNVADLFLTELRDGKNPSVDAYACAFPHLADEIFNEFPTMQLLERAVSKEKPREALPAKRILGGCEIVEEIGRGAMGIVYSAFQKELDRKVAVKVIPLQGSSSATIIDRFELERRAMARLDHANIVPVYAYGHDDEHAFLVMKYIDGPSLDMLFNGKGDYRSEVMLNELRTSWETLGKLGADLASGLQHAHEQGLIHRDIKPANLIIDSRGQVWITDFGLAKIYDYARSLSRTGDAIGTPRYMAPEQLRGACDPRSDVYSLGITLYELASGDRVWNDLSFASVTANRTSLELVEIRERNPSVPEQLAKIIMKACAFSPDDRYQTAKEMHVVLKRFTEGIRPSDRRKRRREPDDVFRKKSRRKIIIAIALMPFVIALMTTLYCGLFSKNETPQSQQIFLVPSPAQLSTANFIEKLAETKDDNFGKVLTEYVRESVEQSGDQLHLAKVEKDELVKQVDHVLSRAKERKVEGNATDTFLDGYRNTTLPTGTRIISLTRVVEKSTLTETEKKEGYATLRHFARAVVNRSIPEKTALKVIAELSGGKLLGSAELESFKISPRALRSWLSTVSRLVAPFPNDASTELRIHEEIERAMKHGNIQTKSTK